MFCNSTLHLSYPAWHTFSHSIWQIFWHTSIFNLDLRPQTVLFSILNFTSNTFSTTKAHHFKKKTTTIFCTSFYWLLNVNYVNVIQINSLTIFVMDSTEIKEIVSRTPANVEIRNIYHIYLLRIGFFMQQYRFYSIVQTYCSHCFSKTTSKTGLMDSKMKKPGQQLNSGEQQNCQGWEWPIDHEDRIIS